MRTGRPKTPLILTEDERQQLTSLAHRSRTAAGPARRARIIPEGIAQRLYASTDSLRADDESGPDLRHQFIVRKYSWRCTHQHEQQIEGKLGQSDLGGGARDALARKIDHEVGDFVHLQRPWRAASDIRLHDRESIPRSVDPRDCPQGRGPFAPLAGRGAA